MLPPSPIPSLKLKTIMFHGIKNTLKFFLLRGEGTVVYLPE